MFSENVIRVNLETAVATCDSRSKTFSRLVMTKKQESKWDSNPTLSFWSLLGQASKFYSSYQTYLYVQTPKVVEYFDHLILA